MVNNRPTVYNTSSVYKTGAGGGGGDIPPEYTEHYFIRNKGRAKVVINKSIKGWGIEIIWAKNSYSQAGPIFFYGHNNGSNDLLGWSNGEFVLRNAGYTVTSASFNPPTYELIKVDAKQNGSRRVNATIQYGQNNFTLSENNATVMVTSNYIVLFGSNNNIYESVSTHCDIYAVKIFDTYQELQLDLVPCQNNDTGEIGFYDKLNKVFYPASVQEDVEIY